MADAIERRIREQAGVVADSLLVAATAEEEAEAAD